MDLKFNVKFLFVDVSLKPLRYVTGACAIPYTLHVEIDTLRASSHESGRKEPWWARRVEQGSERTIVHMGKLLPLHFPSKTSGTKSLPLAIQCMPHRILFHP
jgi:hypothetical protein